MAAPVRYYDRVEFTSLTSGLFDFVVGAASIGRRVPAVAGVPNGTAVRYVAESSDQTIWEVGLGTYSSATPTVIRVAVTSNSAGTTAKINFPTAPVVWFDYAASDAVLHALDDGTGAINLDGTLILGAAAVNSGTLQFAGVTSGVVTVQAQDATGTYTIKWPLDDGAPGDVLTTDGAGVTDWLPPTSGAPGAPQYSIQFNNPLGTFDGDADLSWYPAGTASPGTSTTGGFANNLHSAFGNTSEIYHNSVIMISDELVGDFSGQIISGIGAYKIGFTHTGATNCFPSGMDLEPTVNAATTGPISETWSIFSQLNNVSSGTVGLMGGIQAAVFFLGTGAINQLVCVAGDWHVGRVGGSPVVGAISSGVRSFGASGEMRGGTTVPVAVGFEAYSHTNNDGANTITANYGIYVHDQTAPTIVGGSLTFGTNYNIFSAGTSVLGTGSINRFEGRLHIGNLGEPSNNYYALNVGQEFNGDLELGSSTVWIGARIWPSFVHTGVGPNLNFRGCYAINSQPSLTINTGTHMNEFIGVFCQPGITGPGKLSIYSGAEFQPYHNGTGEVSIMTGVKVNVNLDCQGVVMEELVCIDADVVSIISTATTTTVDDRYGIRVWDMRGILGDVTFGNSYGLWIADQKAQTANTKTATGNNFNIYSLGATSENVFEGIIRFGTATNSSPTNGDVWFDGTDLKLRTGGVTKTFTVT